jgi:hypothetical protein
VHDIAANLAGEATVEDLLEDYPSLTADRIELARLYAEANPLRGRPRKASHERQAEIREVQKPGLVKRSRSRYWPSKSTDASVMNFR